MKKSFTYLFWVQFLGSFVDNFYKSFLMVFFVFESISLWGLEPKSLISFGSFLFVLPFFLMSTFAGKVSAKYQRSKLIRWIKVWEIGLVIMAFISLHQQNWPALLFVLIGLGIQSTFFSPIKFSTIPEYVPKEKLLWANGWIELGTFVSVLIGSLVGTQSNTFRESHPGIFITLLIAPSIVGYIFAALLKDVPIEDKNIQFRFNFIASIYNEIHYFYQQKNIFYPIIGIAIFWFNGIWGLTLLPIITKEAFGGTESLVSVFLFLFTLGIGVGSLLSSLRKPNSLVKPWIIGMNRILMVVLIALWIMGRKFVAYESLWQWVFEWHGLLFSLLLIILSFVMGLYVVPLYTLLQTEPPVSQRSKAIANHNIYNALFMVISTGIFFGLTKLIAIHHFFVVLFFINIVFDQLLVKKFPDLTTP